MPQIKHKRLIRFFGCFSLQLLLIFLPNFDVLAEMSSASFKIPSDVVSVGGGRAASASFIVEDTIGEAATGEDPSSASYKMCAGFQCLAQGSFLSFSVKEGTSSPGTAGAGVALGGLTSSAVATSGAGSPTVNSIFITGESSAGSSVIQVRSANAALKSTSIPTAAINSVTDATLTAGEEEYGLCVFSVSNLTASAPYNGTCDKTTGHSIGIVDGTTRTILTAAGLFQNGAAEILVKASVTSVTPAAPDYADTLTFTMTTTY